jgi:hypothetical protein
MLEPAEILSSAKLRDVEAAHCAGVAAAPGAFPRPLPEEEGRSRWLPAWTDNRAATPCNSGRCPSVWKG